jgi:hexosaminidase
MMFGWGKMNVSSISSGSLSGCEINIANSTDDAFQLGDDESYSLVITADSPVTCSLKANSVWGGLRGLESLAQLIDYSTLASTYQLRMAPWNITDMPTFPHRGVMIDTARHFLSVPTIFRQIDALSYNKMNTLHWHAVDADSFPIISAAYPNLATLGSYSSSIVGPSPTQSNSVSVADSTVSVGMYSVAEQEEIVEYARMRGIRCASSQMSCIQENVACILSPTQLHTHTHHTHTWIQHTQSSN